MTRANRRIVCTVFLYIFGLQTGVLAHYPLAPLPAVAAAPAVVLPWIPLATIPSPTTAGAPRQDLRAWTTAGAAGHGSWTAAADGSAVTQTLGGTKPTFLLSPDDA